MDLCAYKYCYILQRQNPRQDSSRVYYLKTHLPKLHTLLNLRIEYFIRQKLTTWREPCDMLTEVVGIGVAFDVLEDETDIASLITAVS